MKKIYFLTIIPIFIFLVSNSFAEEKSIDINEKILYSKVKLKQKINEALEKKNYKDYNFYLQKMKKYYKNEYELILKEKNIAREKTIQEKNKKTELKDNKDTSIQIYNIDKSNIDSFPKNILEYNLDLAKALEEPEREYNLVIKVSKIPKEIKNLKNIYQLTIHPKTKNESIKIIPEEFSELKKLNTLGIMDNNLKELGKGIEKLESLKNFYIKNNSISTKSLFNSLSKIKTLESLSINSDNKLFTKEIFEKTSKLTNLKYLSLSSLKTSKIEKEISLLKKLEQLSLVNFDLEKIPLEITKLKNLKKIGFYGSKNINQIDFYQKISYLENLEWLTISTCNFTKIDESIKKLKKLKTLNLFGNNIEKIPDFIFEMDNLEVVNLQINKIKSLPDKIKDLKKLRKIILIGNPIKKENIPLNLRDIVVLSESIKK
ncbi:MAG: hypothetical protein AABZ74_19015 [Cyanobacteriota bacterium]